MLRLFLVFSKFVGVAVCDNKLCKAAPRQLQIIRDQLGLELESVAHGIESGCSKESSSETRDSEYEHDGWELVFRATAGNGVDTYTAWETGQFTTSQKPISMRTCYTHYRNPDVDKWTELDIDEAKCTFFENGKETAYVIFNGRTSGKDTWFSKDRVIA